MIADWTQFYYLVFYFIIYSVGGWAVESLYRSICEKRLVNSGFMYGPYCPIYGFGTLIMILVLQNLKGDISLLFIVSFVVLSLWEYGVGIYLEKLYHTKYWDYSNHKINLNGRICLTNSIYWGVLGVVFTLIIHPFVANHSLTVPVNTVFYVDLIIGIIMILDFIITSIKTHSISTNIEKLKNLSEKIKNKLTKPKESKNEVKKYASKDTDLEELQIEHNKLTMAIYRQLRRMKNAFPTMQSEDTNKFLNGKVDVEELKKKIKEIKERTKILKKNVKNKQINEVATTEEEMEEIKSVAQEENRQTKEEEKNKKQKKTKKPKEK